MILNVKITRLKIFVRTGKNCILNSALVKSIYFSAKDQLELTLNLPYIYIVI